MVVITFILNILLNKIFWFASKSIVLLVVLNPLLTGLGIVFLPMFGKNGKKVILTMVKTETTMIIND